MVEHEVDVENIHWPKKCAYCNAPAEATVTARCRAVKSVGYFVIFWTTTTQEIAINYPVCAAHYRNAKIASVLSQRNMLFLALGVISIFFLFAAGMSIYVWVFLRQQPEATVGWLVFMFTFPAVYWWLYFWAKNNAPIRIKDTKGVISFVFSNDQFGREFVELNGIATEAEAG